MLSVLFLKYHVLVMNRACLEYLKEYFIFSFINSIQKMHSFTSKRYCISQILILESTLYDG